MCKGAPLDKVLRHEMQHLLCDTSHNKSGPVRPCSPDPTFACDKKCGLDPQAEGRCGGGTVDTAQCVPTNECQ
jgi:hypothetical protein